MHCILKILGCHLQKKKQSSVILHVLNESKTNNKYLQTFSTTFQRFWVLFSVSVLRLEFIKGFSSSNGVFPVASRGKNTDSVKKAWGGDKVRRYSRSAATFLLFPIYVFLRPLWLARSTRAPLNKSDSTWHGGSWLALYRTLWEEYDSRHASFPGRAGAHFWRAPSTLQQYKLQWFCKS